MLSNYIISHNLYTNVHWTAVDLNDVHKNRTCIHAHLHVYIRTSNPKPICLLVLSIVLCVQIDTVNTGLCVFSCAFAFCLDVSQCFVCYSFYLKSKHILQTHVHHQHRLCACVVWTLSSISQCLLKINTFTWFYSLPFILTCTFSSCSLSLSLVIFTCHRCSLHCWNACCVYARTCTIITNQLPKPTDTFHEEQKCFFDVLLSCRVLFAHFGIWHKVQRKTNTFIYSNSSIYFFMLAIVLFFFSSSYTKSSFVYMTFQFSVPRERWGM